MEILFIISVSINYKYPLYASIFVCITDISLIWGNNFQFV